MTSSIQDARSQRVIPAQAHFLTIYNPTLGDTDETEKNQIVFWIGRNADGELRTTKSRTRDNSKGKDNGNSAINQHDTRHDNSYVGIGTDGNDADDMEHKRNAHAEHDDPEDDPENDERLRQIGLARGMVEFGMNFSSKPVESIETEKSRIILHELEPSWWIMASIDLTRLPASGTKSASASMLSALGTMKSGNKDKDKDGTVSQDPQYEYSTREVTPGHLLLSQLKRAHAVFLLHHSATLWELYNRVGATRFSTLLDRYWSRFFRSWDVLLHGNPAVEYAGDGRSIKLSGGGELGIGVGEEEWGSGEREVIEGFLERTEGLLDLVVGRYGDEPAELKRSPSGGKGTEQDQILNNIGPWLGNGHDPRPQDGVVFSGVGSLSRKSLSTVSQWMEDIFRYGEKAYGVGDNPARSRPTRKQARETRAQKDQTHDSGKEDFKSQNHKSISHTKSSKGKQPDLRRKAMTNNASPPGIPAPLVGTIEQSLDQALTSLEAGKDGSGRVRATVHDEQNPTKTDPENSSYFDKDTMMKVFTLGLWKGEPERVDKSDGQSSSTSIRPKPSPDEEKDNDKSGKKIEKKVASPTNEQELPVQPASPRSAVGQKQESKPAEERLQELDPTPAVSDDEDEQPFVQRLEQSIGRFLIGLSGDLENTELDDDGDSLTESSSSSQSPRRLFHRTLIVELAPSSREAAQLGKRSASRDSLRSAPSIGSTGGPEPKTSAAASVDGASSVKAIREKVMVAVYVHQPFIFVFLFELHTPSLSLPAFYQNIHHQLGPLQKPLLQRTDPLRVAERIKSAMESRNNSPANMRNHLHGGHTIYDLVYDPTKLTVRTSIPNIPIPNLEGPITTSSSTVSGSWYTLGIPIGSVSPSRSRSPSGAKEPGLSPDSWTRVEALNVHTQILNALYATRSSTDLERSIKTNRGWWVSWMKIRAPGKEDEQHKEAILVRKAADHKSTPSREMRSSGAGRWLLRDQTRESTVGPSGSPGNGSSIRGISEGAGIDARKWVEGLLSLMP